MTTLILASLPLQGVVARFGLKMRLTSIFLVMHVHAHAIGSALSVQTTEGLTHFNIFRFNLLQMAPRTPRRSLT